MTKKTTNTSMHIDNFHLVKKLSEDYQKAFYRLYDYLAEDHRKSDMDKSIVANIALEQCFEGMKKEKKPLLVIPKDLKEYVAKYTKGPIYKDMKRKLRDQDYEKMQMASIWLVFTMTIVLIVFKNILMQDFFVNYWIDLFVGVVASVFAYQNFKIKKRLIVRYNFGKIYYRIDAITLGACIFIKLISPSNADLSYLLLVLSFFITKKKMKPQFEAVIEPKKVIE